MIIHETSTHLLLADDVNIRVLDKATKKLELLVTKDAVVIDRTGLEVKNRKDAVSAVNVIMEEAHFVMLDGKKQRFNTYKEAEEFARKHSLEDSSIHRDLEGAVFFDLGLV